MFTSKHYVPILKTKEGELSALAVTSENVLANMTPLFELMDYVPKKYTAQELANLETPPHSIGAHFSNQVDLIAKSWQNGGKVFIDLHLLSPETFRLVPTLPKAIFETLNSKGIRAIPVVHAGTSPEIITILREIQAVIGCGYLIRLKRQDLASNAILEAIQNKLECPAQQIDVLLDYASIHGESATTLLSSISTFINRSLYQPNKWRTLTLGAGAFPANLHDYTPLAQKNVSRNDWKLWTQLTKYGLKRDLAYSDYSISNPNHQTSRRIFNGGPSIRYTSGDDWRIMPDRGKPGRDEDPIRRGCKALVLSPAYDGPGFSWGDRQILKCAVYDIGTGSAKEWRKIGNNRHFGKTWSMIAGLSV